MKSVTIPPVHSLAKYSSPRGRCVNVHTGRKFDLLVETKVEIPSRISSEQEELLRKLAELEETEVAPERKSWLDSIKEFFSGTEEEG